MFCLSGRSSILSCDMFPRIELDATKEWELAFIDMTSYNSIPNIVSGKNNIFYYIYGNESEKKIEIPTGLYEISHIEEYISKKLPTNVSFSLKPNLNTLDVELQSSAIIDFSKPNSLADLLGFEKKQLGANQLHKSLNAVNINPVNSIRIECNLTRGAYQNGIEGHIIHEMYISVPPGYKLIEIAKNIIYMPVNVQRIDNVTVTFRDQSGELINFQSENISLRLHLRQKYGSSI